MISFLAPFALAGAALLAIPVILHLFKPRKVRRTPFSSLRWLHLTQQKLARRIKWHQVLLFLLRFAFIALLVLAIAKPVLNPPGTTAGGFVDHTCGRTASGTAYCWGDNEVGQLGDGSTVDRLEPSAVVGGFLFTSLDAGYRHTCGRATTGALYCWGANLGQLGDGTTTNRSVPTKVFGQP